ncbi:hypothetical protein DFH06DRAFT_1372849 [Mycena polygramma]|nr:hypothetical protein DFH06DRAFT_1372849 [Mycena polygramma]
MQNILFIGGTGYIGGPIFSRFIEKKDPKFNITALVRSTEKAEKLRALNVQINIVSGSHDDAALVERLASEADVVFSLADSDNLPAAESILRGLKKRFDTTGAKPKLIHLVSCLGDGAKGMFASHKVYKDTDLEALEALPATQSHRNVDLAIIAADVQGYIDSYIFFPGLVFGTPCGVLAKAGVQNAKNLGFTFILGASFKRRGAGFVGEGKNIIAIVDVNEIADLVEVLYTAASAKHAAHGKQGYYFAATGEISWAGIAEVVATRAGAARPYTQKELDTTFPGLKVLHDFLGDNGRADAERSRSLGWKPVKGTPDFLAELREVVAHWKI